MTDNENPNRPPSTKLELATRPTRVRYTALAWLTCAAALAYLCRSVFGIAESSIRAEFDVSKSEMGWVMGTFFLSYAFLQIPAGMLSQRFGARLALSGFAFLWAVSAILIGVSPVFWLLFVAQIGMGLAQAGAFPAATQSISKWMPLSQRSIACGILAAGMQVGAIVAVFLAGILITGGWSQFVIPLVNWTVPGVSIDPISWRWIYVIFAIPSLIWVAGFFLRFRDDPQAHSRVNFSELELIRADSPSQPTEAGPIPWAAALKSKTLWLLCAQQFFRAAGYSFFVTWFPTYIQESNSDVTIEKSGLFLAIILSSLLVGSLFGGAIVDSVYRRTRSLRTSRSKVGAICLSLTGVLILGAFFVNSLPAAIALLASAAFLSGLAGPCSYSTAIDISGRHVAPFFGMMNMWGNIGAGGLPILLGILFDWLKKGGFDSNSFVLFLLAGIYFAGAVCWLFIDPSRKISAESEEKPAL
ncbi:MAG: ACS family D-galactonate transporter-like MFS transporter [Verrucomicrobiales bacterium]